VVIDPRTGFTKQFQTELLVDAFQLPVSASGSFDSTSGDTETRRDVRCAPSRNETFAGAYLFEASATLPDGRIVGNRSIICVNNYLLTQKRTPTTAIMRLAKMSDASSVAGVTIRAVTEENIELARAVTNKNGIAEFPKDTVFPKTPNAKSTHLFIADTATGPALQFAEATAYSSGSDYSPPPKSSHAEIVTDRNLYRPGQTVKMKGLARDVSVFSGLMIPFGADVHWSVTEGDGSRVVGEGDTTLSAYGGWEAEWKVPDKARELRDSLPCCRARLRRSNAHQRSGVSRSAVFSDRRSTDTGGRHNSSCPDFLRVFSWRTERSRACALESDLDDIRGVRERSRRRLSQTFQLLLRGRPAIGR